MARKKTFTKKRQTLFIETIADTGNASEAARVSEMNRQYCYEFADNNPAFKARWDNAHAEYLDAIDAEAHRRAIPGIKRLKQKTKKDKDGNVIETIQEATTYHSDRLLEFILTNRHPDYKRKLAVEASGPGGAPIPFEDKSQWDLSGLSFDELKTLRALHAKARPAQSDAG